ncbi:hypothetical protein N2152v2_008064 [Parachlorella kessleri]
MFFAESAGSSAVQGQATVCQQQKLPPTGPGLNGAQQLQNAQLGPQLQEMQAAVLAQLGPQLQGMQAAVLAQLGPQLLGMQAAVLAQLGPQLQGMQAAVLAQLGPQLQEMQAAVQQLQEQVVQLQEQVGQLQGLPNQVGQLQEQIGQLQGLPNQVGQLEGRVGQLEGNQNNILDTAVGVYNLGARLSNRNALVAAALLVPLRSTGQQHGGEQGGALGALPPPGLFPGTRGEMHQLTHDRLNTLANFYGENWGPPNELVAQRRMAFEHFIFFHQG